MERLTVRIVDGEGRTVCTAAAPMRRTTADLSGRAYLQRTRETWTHCDEADRASWGFMVWDEAGNLLAHG